MTASALTPLERLALLRQQQAETTTDTAGQSDPAAASETATDPEAPLCPELGDEPATDCIELSEDEADSVLDFSDLNIGDEFAAVEIPTDAVIAAESADGSGDAEGSGPGSAVSRPTGSSLPESLSALEARLSDLLGDEFDDRPPQAGPPPETAEPPAAKPGDGRPQYIAAGRGGVRKLPPRPEQPAAGSNRVDALIGRVDGLLGTTDDGEPFRPQAPQTVEQIGLPPDQIERLALKFLAHDGQSSGREIAAQLRLPFEVMTTLLKRWKADGLVVYRGSAEMDDFQYQLSDSGQQRAADYAAECTYFGAAPVSLPDYLHAMEAQSIAKQQASVGDLERAFGDLSMHPSLLDRLGPAINSGRGLFLYGSPGNGKTAVAERITSCFDSAVWIPRALGIDGEIIRLYDPGLHEAVDWDDAVGSGSGLFGADGLDQRWIRIVRPTVIAGGELTMSELEVVQNPTTKICESPLQLKSNCGTLVIDDFGRQTMPMAELLNRWVVPLEKRSDFLNLPSGKKIQMPFDQLIVFSTTMAPGDLVDQAFLRRIPYKVQVPDPLPEHFRELFRTLAPEMGLQYDEDAVDHLIKTHYEQAGRERKACHPRDLLLQVRNEVIYRGCPKVLTRDAFDEAVATYFS